MGEWRGALGVRRGMCVNCTLPPINQEDKREEETKKERESRAGEKKGIQRHQGVMGG